MALLIGHIIALIFIVISALVGFISLEASVITFLAIAYLVWLLILLSNFFTKPSKEAPLCQLLNSNEIEVYRRYHLYFWFPGGAQVYSCLMNGLRIAGFVWAALCIWKGLYWQGVMCIAYYFITGGLIVMLDPQMIIGAEAQKGNQFSIEQLSLIERIQEKRKTYNQ